MCNLQNIWEKIFAIVMLGMVVVVLASCGGGGGASSGNSNPTQTCVAGMEMVNNRCVVTARSCNSNNQIYNADLDICQSCTGATPYRSGRRGNLCLAQCQGHKFLNSDNVCINVSVTNCKSERKIFEQSSWSCQSCPRGQSPNAAGTACQTPIQACPVGEVRNTLDDCIACPIGQAASPDDISCVPSSATTCKADGQKFDGTNCIKCMEGQVLDRVGTACVEASITTCNANNQILENGNCRTCDLYTIREGNICTFHCDAAHTVDSSDSVNQVTRGQLNPTSDLTSEIKSSINDSLSQYSRRLVLDSFFAKDNVHQLRTNVEHQIQSRAFAFLESHGQKQLSSWQNVGFIDSGNFALHHNSMQVDMLGALHHNVNRAAAWQVRGAGNFNSTQQWNVGVMYRKAFANYMVGAHTFYDWQKSVEGVFGRSGIGGEMQHAWGSIFAAMYVPMRRTIRERQFYPQTGPYTVSYSAGGLEMQAVVHSPNRRWLLAEAGFAFWDGEYGQADEKQLYTGVRLHSSHLPLSANIRYRYNNGETSWYMRAGAEWDLGGKRVALAKSTPFVAQQALLNIPQRNYQQRIRTAIVGAQNQSVPDIKAIADGMRPTSAISKRWENVLSKSAKYIINTWFMPHHTLSSSVTDFLISNISVRNEEQKIRAATQYAFALAVLLRFGDFDENVVGIPKSQAQDIAVHIIRSLAACHISNHTNTTMCSRWDGLSNTGDLLFGGTWSAHVGAAAWMLWPHLQDNDRVLVQNMVAYHANQHMNTPPIYNNQNSCVNSEAETVGWHAWILEVATNMFPHHANATAWRKAAELYRHAALAQASDDSSTVQGYNLTDDFAIGNHGLYPHPSYTAAAARQPLIGVLYYHLGGQQPPSANYKKIANMYKMFVQKVWRTNPPNLPLNNKTIYASDGTINWPGNKEKERAKNYWTYASLDAMVNLAKLDSQIDAGNTLAATWEEKHLSRIEQAQNTKGAIVLRSDIPEEHQWQQFRDVAATYLAHWIANNNGGRI